MYMYLCNNAVSVMRFLLKGDVCLEQLFSNFRVLQNHLKGLENVVFWTPSPEFSVQ